MKDIKEEITLRVWDQDATKSDAVGMQKIRMTDLVFNNGVDNWFDILHRGKKSGSVRLKTEFAPAGGDAF